MVPELFHCENLLKIYKILVNIYAKKWKKLNSVFFVIHGQESRFNGFFYVTSVNKSCKTTHELQNDIYERIFYDRKVVNVWITAVP